MTCNHDTLFLGPSAHATVVGYRRPTDSQRLAATVLPGRPAGREVSASTFPGPLVLPGDDLELNPRMPPQNYRSFIRNMEDDFEVTPTRNVIYVVAPPEIRHSVSYMETWTQPTNPARDTWKRESVPYFVRDVMDYLQAFYTGLSVRRLALRPPLLCFANWDPATSAELHATGPGAPQRIPEYLGIVTGDGERKVVGIKTRVCPDRAFPVQLSVMGFVNATLNTLPEDGYCLLFIVNQDLYYKEADNFVTGVTFPEKRFALLSTARYNPSLDDVHRVQREHVWPASHCREYVYRCLNDHLISYRQQERLSSNVDGGPSPYIPPQSQPSNELLASPMYVALRAFKGVRPPDFTQPGPVLSLWLWRICTSASRQIGYCFGIHHCVYYACMMQSATMIRAQVRLPPYLCPVDLAKVLRMTGKTPQMHYEALLEFFGRYSQSRMFDAFVGWIRVRLNQIQEKEEEG